MMVTPNVRLVRPLGEGGMGSVWVAEHLSLRTQVVVKFMARDLAKSQEAIARFSREAAAASQVKSPHVVQMLDHGVGEDGTPYIVMELLEGRDLEQHIRASGKVDPREMIAVVAQLARALAKAHERGIVHRDIKPSNVFLLDAGGGELFVKLLDFGVARIAKGPEVGIVGSTTRTGSFVGSPYYMSPEQVVGAKNIDFRTDLWSLGVVTYEALTGDKPFHAETMGALALKIHRDPIPVPSRANPALPAALDAWFGKACAREPGDRFASAKEMAEALAVALTGEAIPAGLNVDSVPSPRKPVGLETTLGASSSSGGSTLRSGVDARSETGAGVGLVTSGQAGGGAGRSKWWMAGGVGLVALVIGFEVPKLVAKKTAAAPAESATASASATATASAATTSEAAMLSPLETTAPAPSAAADTATMIAAAGAASAPPGLPIASVTAAAAPRPAASARAATPHARPRARPSATAAAATAHPTATATTPPGSDDEIK